MDGIIRCEDGSYRWVYEKSLLRDPTIPLMVVKCLLISMVIFWILIFLMMLGEGPEESLGISLKITGVTGAIIAVLFLISYPIYALMMGGTYCVSFVMDEEGITHTQHEKQAKKAEVLGMITALAGAASRNPTAMGAGMASMRTTMHSEFVKVRRIRLDRRHNTIHLDGNQVYVSDDDIDMVWEFISSRCVKAR